MLFAIKVKEEEEEVVVEEEEVVVEEEETFVEEVPEARVGRCQCAHT